MRFNFIFVVAKQLKLLSYIPPLDKKNDKPCIMTKKLNSNLELESLLRRYQGGCLLGGNDVDEVDFDSIDENQTYRIKSAYYDAVLDERVRRQVDDKVLELEVSLVVKRELDAVHKGIVHLHSNYHLGNKEFDGIIVHVGNENQESDAYIIECGYNPDIDKVASVLNKMDTFKASYKSDAHFASVRRIIPVFGARHFRPEVSKYCLKQKIWQVKPNGFGYQVVRHFSKFIKCCNKIV